jgi:hypothetical protein
MALRMWICWSHFVPYIGINFDVFTSFVYFHCFLLVGNFVNVIKNHNCKLNCVYSVYITEEIASVKLNYWDKYIVVQSRDSLN